MENFQTYRSSSLCYLCSLESQRNFQLIENRIVVSSDFCTNLLTRHKEQILFNNIQLITMLKSLLNINDCYKRVKVPWRLVVKLDKQLAYREIINRCYYSIENKENTEGCLFICDKFKANNFSRFFDGNIELMYQVVNILNNRRKRQRITKEEKMNKLTVD